MIVLKLNGKPFKVPTNFDDVNAKQLHGLTDLKPKTLIENLTEIPSNLVDLMTADQVIQVSDLLSFVESQPVMAQIKEEINVGSESWRKLELTKQVLSKPEPYIAVEVSRLYFGDQVFEWSAELLYGQTAQILQSLSVFLERFKELNEQDEYDPDDLEAGIKGLESFGVGAIRYSLAKGDVTKYDAIEQMDAESIYFTLLYEKAKGEFLRRKEIIIKRQNGIGTRKNS